MTFRFDEESLRGTADELVQQRQEQFNVEMRQVIRDVRDEMNGQLAAQVYPELISRLKAKFETFEPDEDGLREVAGAIESREFAD